MDVSKDQMMQVVLDAYPRASGFEEALHEAMDDGKMGVSRKENGTFHAIMPCPAARFEDEHHGYGVTREDAILQCAYLAILNKMNDAPLPMAA